MSATIDSSDGPVPETTQSISSVEALANELEKTDIQELSDAQTEATQPPDDAAPSSPRPLVIYTRKQLLRLSKSPLVKAPAEMPDFKSWFGCVALIRHKVPVTYSRAVNLTSKLFTPPRRSRRRQTQTVQREIGGEVLLFFYITVAVFTDFFAGTDVTRKMQVCHKAACSSKVSLNTFDRRFIKTSFPLRPIAAFADG